MIDGNIFYPKSVESNFHCARQTTNVPWFHTFTVFCMLYVFFWVIPRRLNFICWRFGTLCLFHLHGQVGEYWIIWENLSNLFIIHLLACEDETECFETSAYKIQMPGNYLEENIQHTEQGGSLKSRIIIIPIITITCHVSASDQYQPVQSQLQRSVYKGIQDQHTTSSMCAHIIT